MKQTEPSQQETQVQEIQDIVDAVMTGALAPSDIPLRDLYNLDFLCNILEKDSLFLFHLSFEKFSETISEKYPKFPNDRKHDLWLILVCIAVKNNGLVLEFADDKSKNSFAAVRLAIETYAQAFQYASDEMKKNKDLVKKLLTVNGAILKYIEEEFQNDAEVIEIAVTQNPLTVLPLIPVKFRTEQPVAYQNILLNNLDNGLAKILQDDARFLAYLPFEAVWYEYVYAAVKKDPWAIQYANEIFRTDLTIVLKAISQESETFQFASTAFKQDPLKVNIALQCNGLISQHFEFAPPIQTPITTPVKQQDQSSLSKLGSLVYSLGETLFGKTTPKTPEKPGGALEYSGHSPSVTKKLFE